MQPEEPFADASAPASMDAGPPSAAVRRRAVSEATTDQEERLGSRRPIRDEANRDGGTMRRVDSLEKLAPELKANQESFVSSGSDRVASDWLSGDDRIVEEGGEARSRPVPVMERCGFTAEEVSNGSGVVPLKVL